MSEGSPRRRPPVLCIDDDEHLLSGLQRVLHSHFSVTTAPSGEQGLEILKARGPFAVVVSDMRMPTMGGVEVLRRARDVSPLTVRVLLTGQADLQDTMGAVNEGHIFRFMTKPCSPRVLIDGLTDAVNQYRLLISERVLLERTLHGSIRALTDILSLTHPAAFGRATRARRDVLELATKLDVPDRWLIEIASMLSQIGCVTLPSETATKLYQGEDLTPEEREMVDHLPEAGQDLLGTIPRLEPVIEILRYQQKHFDGRGVPRDTVSGEEIPWGARALKIVLDYDTLLTQDLEPSLALQVMRTRTGWYDSELLDVFVEIRGGANTTTTLVEIDISEAQPGMVFYEDLHTASGALLIARGQEVTTGLASRLHNLGRGSLASTTVKLLVPNPGAA
jgi:response regulator RpfG family c-di-GMP phosphodiesterase